MLKTTKWGILILLISFLESVWGIPPAEAAGHFLLGNADIQKRGVEPSPTPLDSPRPDVRREARPCGLASLPSLSADFRDQSRQFVASLFQDLEARHFRLRSLRDRCGLCGLDPGLLGFGVVLDLLGCGDLSGFHFVLRDLQQHVPLELRDRLGVGESGDLLVQIFRPPGDLLRHGVEAAVVAWHKAGLRGPPASAPAGLEALVLRSPVELDRPFVASHRSSQSRHSPGLRNVNLHSVSPVGVSEARRPRWVSEARRPRLPPMWHSRGLGKSSPTPSRFPGWKAYSPPNRQDTPRFLVGKRIVPGKSPTQKRGVEPSPTPLDFLLGNEAGQTLRSGVPSSRLAHFCDQSRQFVASLFQDLEARHFRLRSLRDRCGSFLRGLRLGLRVVLDLLGCGLLLGLQLELRHFQQHVSLELCDRVLVRQLRHFLVEVQQPSCHLLGG